MSEEMRSESRIHAVTLTELDFGILVPLRHFPCRKRQICNKPPKCLTTLMYLAKYQHLPDFAAFPINVKLLLYFFCKEHVGKDEPWRKLKMNLTSSHFSPEGRRLSCERCSAPMFPLIPKQTFCFHAVESKKPQCITGQRRYSAAPDTAL